MRWTPRMNDQFSQQIELVVRDLLGVYAQAETNLVRGVALAVRAGVDSEGQLADMQTQLIRMRKLARQAVSSLNEVSPALIEKLIADASQFGLLYALGQLESIPVPFDITRDVPNAPAALALRADLYSRMAQVHERILRLPDDVYRAVIADATSGKLILGGTSRRAEQAAWQKLLSTGVTGFVDSAGRNWNLASYVEMATRTASIRAYHQQAEYTMQANGVQLVTIVVGNDSCPECGPWAGKVCAISGDTGPRSVLNPLTGQLQTVNVEYTLDEARAHGWSHPNCRCSEAAYMPGLDPVVNLNKYDPELEAERTQLRAMERKVRSIKRDVMTSSDSSLSYHKRRLREAQAEIRQHVSQTGLMRKSYREQPNLGYRR